VAAPSDERTTRYASPSAPPVLLRFSPDGQAVAVLSAESGRTEAYVARAEAPADKIRVSSGGAAQLRFSKDGKELYYLSEDGHLMSVPIRSSSSLELGRETPLFAIDPSKPWYGFDVASDGRFLASVEEVSGGTQPATMVVNWLPDVKR
jgi:hypothetical protein